MKYKELNAKDFSAYHGHPIVCKHFELLERATAYYSAVTKVKAYRGPSADQFIAFAKADIDIAPEFYSITKRYKQPVPGYPAFKQLAVLYERRGEYEKAIAVCQEAIRCRFDDDGTKGGMKARLDKLRKKAET